MWVNELGLHKTTDGGKTFTSVETPHGDNHGMWFNPDNPNIILQVNDGGANVSLNGGRSWSSILNQPTAEYYMVAVDEQYPYRLYMPQQDNSTLIIPSVPPVSWGFEHPAQAWQQASGCETGQIWPKPDGKVVWGACKGEVGRYNTVTGQEKHYWVYPQNRYGHDPDEIKYRFPRQTVVYVSPHDSRVIYQASHVLHRSMDEGISWDIISPDLTAQGAAVSDRLGQSDHARRHRRRGLLDHLLDDRIAPRARRDLGRRQRRAGQRDARQRQDVEERDAEGSGRRAHPDRRGFAAREGPRLHRRLPLHARARSQALHLPHGRLRRDVDAADRRQERHPDDHPTRVIREDPRQPGLLYAGTEFGFFVSFNAGKNWQPLQQNLPVTPITDIKVHRNDLVISTMGRSAWIMDNVTPLQQLAAIVNGPRRRRRVASCRLQRASRTSRRSSCRRSRVPAARNDPAIATARRRSSSDEPDIPPSARTSISTSQRAGRRHQARSDRCARARAPHLERRAAEERRRRPEQEMRGGVRARRRQLHQHPRRSRHAAHHRGTCATPVRGRRTRRTAARADRWCRPGNTPSGSPRPARPSRARSTLKSDPRVAADGVTDGDIAEQVKFQLQVRDAHQRRAQAPGSHRAGDEKAGVKPLLAAGLPGDSPSTTKYDHPLQQL